MYNIYYNDIVVKEDIPALDSDVKIRVKKAIESKLFLHPEIFGKPLQYSLYGYRSLRVGEYRIVFSIEHSSMSIYIFLIAHRSIVYREALKRSIR